MVDVDSNLNGGYGHRRLWSESCGACHVVAGKVTEAIATEPKVLFAKVERRRRLHRGRAGLPRSARCRTTASTTSSSALRYDLVGNDS